MPFCNAEEAKLYHPAASSADNFRVSAILRDAASLVGRYAPAPVAKSTTLAEAATASQDYLKLTTTFHFPESGVVQIDNERIEYVAKSATQDYYATPLPRGPLGDQTGYLVGCMRGASGTSPASHSNGAAVADRTYATRAKDAELRLFEYLWTTRGYVGNTSVQHLGSKSYDLRAAERIVREAMGEYAHSAKPVRIVRPEALDREIVYIDPWGRVM
jgi:hypothetical protein